VVPKVEIEPTYHAVLDFESATSIRRILSPLWVKSRHRTALIEVRTGLLDRWVLQSGNRR